MCYHSDTIIYGEKGDGMISNVSIMMLLFTIELIVLETIFCLPIRRRRRFAGKAAVCCLLMIVYIFFFPIAKLGILIQIPLVLLSFLYIWLCYEVSIPQALFIGTAGYTIGQIASMVNSLVTLLMPGRFEHFGADVAVNREAVALIIACYAIAVVITAFLLKRNMLGASLLKNATVPIVLLAMVMLAVNQILGLSFSLYGAAQADRLVSALEYIWNLICCVFCLCIQFGLFQISRREEELAIARQLISEKERQYHISKSTIDTINRKCHNLKYVLSSLSANAESRENINEALAVVNSFDAIVRTENEALNVILSEKSQYCQQQEINLVCMVDSGKIGFMEATDQYVLFGNLIDNAIHAVEKLEIPSQRVIYLKIHAQKKLLMISTENPFIGTLAFRDGLPVTTSGDEDNHGFGMMSIRMICEKYGGALNTRAEDGVFYLNILIPIPE